jgi:hypothetical protein
VPPVPGPRLPPEQRFCLWWVDVWVWVGGVGGVGGGQATKIVLENCPQNSGGSKNVQLIYSTLYIVHFAVLSAELPYDLHMCKCCAWPIVVSMMKIMIA